MSDSEIEAVQSKESIASRSESKLRNSIETYGTNSYYYAHSKSREFLVPEGAKVVEGPGIITGGTPVKLDSSEVLLPSTIRRKMEKYSWCDEGEKVRIYIEDPNVLPLIADSTDAVSCSFDVSTMSLEVRQSVSVVFCLDLELNEEIDPQESSYRVSLGKRITVTLRKKKSQTWHSLKKK